jgi:hypothetical protein
MNKCRNSCIRERADQNLGALGRELVQGSSTPTLYKEEFSELTGSWGNLETTDLVSCLVILSLVLPLSPPSPNHRIPRKGEKYANSTVVL